MLCWTAWNTGLHNLNGNAKKTDTRPANTRTTRRTRLCFNGGWWAAARQTRGTPWTTTPTTCSTMTTRPTMSTRTTTAGARTVGTRPQTREMKRHGCKGQRGREEMGTQKTTPTTPTSPRTRKGVGGLLKAKTAIMEGHKLEKARAKQQRPTPVTRTATWKSNKGLKGSWKRSVHCKTNGNKTELYMRNGCRNHRRVLRGRR